MFKKTLRVIMLSNKLAQKYEQCNCENSACAHSPAGCSNPAGSQTALYVGALCDGCASKMDPKYLIKGGPKANDEMSLEPPKSAPQCHCESDICSDNNLHSPGNCRNTAEEGYMAYGMGHICERCADLLPREQLIDDSDDNEWERQFYKSQRDPRGGPDWKKRVHRNVDKISPDELDYTAPALNTEEMSDEAIENLDREPWFEERLKNPKPFTPAELALNLKDKYQRNHSDED